MCHSERSKKEDTVRQTGDNSESTANARTAIGIRNLITLFYDPNV